MLYKDIRDQLTHGERALAFAVWDVYINKLRGPAPPGEAMHSVALAELIEACEFAARATKGRRRGMLVDLADRLRGLAVKDGN